MLMTKARNEEQTDYDEDLERWAKAQGERTRIQAQLDGAKVALNLQQAISPTEVDRIPQSLLELAEPYAESSEKDLIETIRALTDKEIEMRATVSMERERFDAARRRETNRRAKQLQPAHRDAVLRVKVALQALSDAIEAERSIRSRCSPEPTSRFLPDCSSLLGVGTLNDHGSRLRQWKAEIERLGVLK